MRRLINRLVNPLYEAGQRLHLAGVSPEGTAIATIAGAIAVLAIHTSTVDRAFIESCQQAGGSADLCTLKVSGR